MEESYETFEEELGPGRADPPPQKPVGQIRRPGGNTHTHTENLTVIERRQITRVVTIHDLGVGMLPEKYLIPK